MAVRVKHKPLSDRLFKTRISPLYSSLNVNPPFTGMGGCSRPTNKLGSEVVTEPHRLLTHLCLKSRPGMPGWGWCCVPDNSEVELFRPHLFRLYVRGGCSADCLIVCVLTTETPVCQGLTCLLFIFGVVHREWGRNKEISTGIFRLPSYLERSMGRWKQLAANTLTNIKMLLWSVCELGRQQGPGAPNPLSRGQNKTLYNTIIVCRCATCLC